MRPTTPTGRLLALSATAALSVALLAGCGDDNDDPETAPTDSQSSTSEHTEPSTQPTSTDTPETTEPVTEDDKAAADAEGRLRDYYALEDELTADPESDLVALETFLQNPELTAKRAVLQQLRDQGFTSSGTTSFDSIRATEVQLYPEKDDAAVTLRACLNLDQVVLRDKAGKKVDLLTPALATFEVYNYDYPSPDGWKIAVAGYPGKRCRS